MKKRIISVLLALVMVISMLPATVLAVTTEVASGTCGENLTWMLDNGGVLTISGSGTMEDYRNSNDMPWTDYSDEITSVVIEDGVTSIGDYAFMGLFLTQVQIADSVEKIGEVAFDGCGLESLQLPVNLKYIGYSAFSYNEITEINIPKNVSFIGRNVFHACWNLSYIWVDEENTDFFSDEKGVLYNRDKTQLITVPKNYRGELNILEGTQEILFAAVSDCFYVTGITLPSTLNKIGAFAFQHGSVDRIVIPSGVTYIDACAFQEVYLKEVTFEGDYPFIADDAFDLYYPELEEHMIAYYPANNATWTASALRDYGRPTIWTVIGSEPEYPEPEETEPEHEHAFQPMVVPPSCTEEGHTRYSCSCGYAYLDDFTNAWGHSFGNWYVTKEPTQTQDGQKKRICKRCDFAETRLIDIHPPEESEIIQDGTCGNNLFWTLTTDGRLIISGNGEMTDYSEEVSYIDGITSIQMIPAPWYGYRSEITTVIIRDGITSIGDCAFVYCSNLTSIVFSDSVTRIGWAAFDFCTSLTSIVVPDGVTNIGDSAFSNCSSLTRIIIPGSVTTVGISAFTGCSSLTNVYYEGSVEMWNAITIGSCNENLTNATIDYKITEPETEGDNNKSEDKPVTEEGSCGNGVSWKLVDGTLFVYGEGVIPDYYSVSMGMYGLKPAPWYEYFLEIERIEIGEGITAIGKHAFEGCSRVKTVVVPEGLTSLAYSCFTGCGLIAIELPVSLQSIADAAFFMCMNLEHVYYRGNEQNWNAIYVGSSNEDLTGATVHFSSKLPENISDIPTENPDRPSDEPTEPAEPGEPEYPITTQSVKRLRELVESNGTCVAVFGGYDLDGTVRYDVTEQTNSSFLANKREYLGKYILITVQEGAKNQTGNDILLNAVPVETCVGIATEEIGYRDTVTIDGRSYPVAEGIYLDRVYNGRSVLYHLRNGEVVGLKELSCVEGTLVEYNANTVEIVLKGCGGAKRIFGFYGDIAEEYGKYLESSWNQPVYVKIYHQDGLVHKVGNWDGEGYYDELEEESKKDTVESLERCLTEFDLAYQNYVNQLNVVLGNVSSLDNASREELIRIQADKMRENDERRGTTKYINPVEKKYKEAAYLALAEYLLDLTEITIPNFSQVDFSRKDVSTQMIKKLAASVDSCETKAYTYGDITVEITGMNNYGVTMGLITYWENGHMSLVSSGFTKDPDQYKEVVRSFAEEMEQMTLNVTANVARAVCDDLLVALCGYKISTLKEKTVEKAFNKLTKKFNQDVYGQLINIGVGRIDTVLDKCYSFNKAANGLIKAIKKAELEKVASYMDKYLDETMFDGTIKDAIVDETVKRLDIALQSFNQALLNYVEANTTRAVYSVARINCPVTVAVYNSTGEQIGYVGDDDIWFTDAIYISRLGDSKEILALTEDDISYVITATDYGTMSCSFEKYDENGSPRGRLNYYDITLSPQRVFSALPPQDPEATAEMMAVVSDYLMIPADEYMSLDNEAFVMIQCVTESNTGETGGTVWGSNTYIRGDVVLLSAEAEEGYSFAGWFDGDVLLETKEIYQFTAREDKILEARFEKDECIHIELDVDAGGVALGEGKYQLGERVELVAAPYEGYAFVGWYVAEQLVCADQEYSFNASEHQTVHVKFEAVCENKHTEVIDVAVDPTCIETGLTEGRHCSVCGLVLIPQMVIDSLGHDFENGRCVNCGEAEVTKALGDIDGNGTVDVDDVLALLWNVLFPEDYPIETEADFDENGTVDVDDVLALLWHVLFPDEYPI